MSKQAGLVIAECCSPLMGEPVATAEAETLARVFKALGDPIRLRLLSLIGAHAGGLQAGVGVCVCDLTAAFEVTAPTISHHLKVLREAGLIASERRGTWVYYWIVAATVERLGAVLRVPEAVPAAEVLTSDLPGAR